MVIVPGDPRIDPGIRVPPPKDHDYTIRRIEPTVCRP
jgi:hypothetical protein